MSCAGLAALGALALGDALTREDQSVARSMHTSDVGTTIREHDRSAEMLPQGPSRIIPGSSLTAANVGISSEGVAAQRNHAERPSNVVPIHGAKQHRDPLAGDHGRTRPFSIRRDPSNIGNHIPAFVRQCLRSALGSSLGASELRGSYETWCAVRKYEPVTQQKLGAELKGLGFAKWKSCGLIRYRDLQLIA